MSLLSAALASICVVLAAALVSSWQENVRLRTSVREIVSSPVSSPGLVAYYSDGVQQENPEQLLNELSVLYEAHPYPSIQADAGRVDEYPTCSFGNDELHGRSAFQRLLHSPSNLRRAAMHAWGGKVPAHIRVLDAGAGTGEDCVDLTLELLDLDMMDSDDPPGVGRPNSGELPFEVVCLEQSAASLAVLERRFREWGIPPAAYPTIVRGSIVNRSLLATLGPFDYIHADGLIMHQSDPAASVRTLASVLRGPSR